MWAGCNVQVFEGNVTRLADDNGMSSNSNNGRHHPAKTNGLIRAATAAATTTTSVTFPHPPPLLVVIIISLYCSVSVVQVTSSPLFTSSIYSSSSSSSSSSNINNNSRDNHQNNNNHNGGSQMADVIAIKEGADLDLSCPIVVPNEDMIISWTCDNEPADIRSSRHHVTESGKLRIRSAKVGDSCNYRCEAADGFGTLSVIIKVIIVDKSRIEQLAHHRGYFDNNNNNNDSSISHNRTGAADKQHQRPAAAHMMPRYNKGPPRPDGDARSPASGKSIGPSDLEVYIEPAKVDVGKNRTFDLECRVKHAPHLLAPQIIWLKEFMGARPSSFEEANAQGLILLDDVYYHSLNWPRSISYSQHSTANSALLIRHSAFVHSGRYVCFAGYPPPKTTNRNLMTPASTSTQQPIPTSQLIIADRPSPVQHDQHSPPDSAPSIKPSIYKIAQAIVHVDDREGQLNYESRLKANNDLQSSTSFSLWDAIASNSWIRNLSIILILACSLALMIKYVQVRGRTEASSTNTKHNNNNNKDSGENNGVEAMQSQRIPPTSSASTRHDNNNYPSPNANRLSILRAGQQQQQQQPPPPPPPSEQRSVKSIYSDQVIDSLVDKKHNHPSNDFHQTPSDNDVSCKSAEQTLLMKLDGQLMRISEEQTTSDQNEHVYSEIGETDSTTTTKQDPYSTKEPYYKTPNKR